MLWDDTKLTFIHELGEKVLISAGKDMPWEYSHKGTVIGIWQPKMRDSEVIHYLIAFDNYRSIFKITEPMFADKFEEEYVWDYYDYVGKVGDWVPRSRVKFLDSDENPRRFLGVIEKEKAA